MAPEGRDTAVKDDEASSSVVTGERQEDEGEEWDGEEMVPVPVDATLLAQLLSMDFSDTRARKGLVHGSTLEGALSWLEENADSPDLDQPYMVKRKDAVPKKPLTAEEKQEKLLQLKEKAAQLKREREKKEKAEEIAREKQRRTRGQTDVETDEERQRLARKREAARKKKEKDVSVDRRWICSYLTFIVFHAPDPLRMWLRSVNGCVQRLLEIRSCARPTRVFYLLCWAWTGEGGCAI